MFIVLMFAEHRRTVPMCSVAGLTGKIEHGSLGNTGGRFSCADDRKTQENRPHVFVVLMIAERRRTVPMCLLC